MRISTGGSTSEATSGDAIHANLAEPPVVDRGTEAAWGTDFEGVIVESNPCAQAQAVAWLTVALRHLKTDTGKVDI